MQQAPRGEAGASGKRRASRLTPSPWVASRAPAEEFRLLLATARPAVHTFFVNVGRQASSAFVVTRIPVNVGALDHQPGEVASATTAIVDVALDQAAAIELCQELHVRRPDLPVSALVCCPNAVTPWNLRALLWTGVSSVLDLAATSEEALRALYNVALGGTILHFHSLGGHRPLREILSPHALTSAANIQLLELVARGLPDHEIGRRLHLSPHTVKHHIENLRDQVGARNRIELAAWAGRNGFYAPDSRRAAG